MVIPFWHPVVVHFPIALLIVGGAAALVWAVSGQALARRAALLMVGLGALGALAATRTGEAMEHEVDGAPSAERFLDAHEQAGEWTLYAAVAAALALAAAEALERRRTPRATRLTVRVIAAVLAVAAAGFVARTGHLGGLMTWGVPAETVQD